MQKMDEQNAIFERFGSVRAVQRCSTDEARRYHLRTKPPKHHFAVDSVYEVSVEDSVLSFV